MTVPFVFQDHHLEFERSVATLAKREFYEGYLARATSEAFLWKELETLGRNDLLGLSAPVEIGGQDADPVMMGIAVEQLAYADFNVSYLVFGTALAKGLLGTADPEIGRRLAKAMIAGKEVVAGAFTEPRGGSDAAHPAVRARPTGDGFRLSGEKTSITLGMHASEAIVVATIDPTLGSKGTRQFLVPLDDPSIHRQQFRDPGFRPLSRASLTFDDTFVPAGREIRPKAGEKGSGIGRTLHAFDLTRPLLALMVVGAARRALDMTIRYVTEREAFGQKISRYQGVSFNIAEHDTLVEAARWLAYRTLGLRAAGQKHTREAAMCKWWAPRVAVDAINDCIVLHGHLGWSVEMPLQQLLFDASGLQIGDGTPQIQKLVIARELMGREMVG